jgi:hypothetical protein
MSSIDVVVVVEVGDVAMASADYFDPWYGGTYVQLSDEEILADNKGLADFFEISRLVSAVVPCNLCITRTCSPTSLSFIHRMMRSTLSGRKKRCRSSYISNTKSSSSFLSMTNLFPVIDINMVRELNVVGSK